MRTEAASSALHCPLVLYMEIDIDVLTEFYKAYNIHGIYIWLIFLIICQKHKKHVIGEKLRDNDEKDDGIVDEIKHE